jgi:ectoine hydroxylase-related dioxygenase (phytanoyl-CoA dioxygenase family)
MLSSEDIEHYARDGYLLLRGQIDEASLRRFERGLAPNMPLDGKAGNVIWLRPDWYILATNRFADRDLGFMAEHERIVPVVAALLEDDPVLLSFQVYGRTSGGRGLHAHHDYKRWRPIGSSLRWCFAIVPLTDFDDVTGPLYIAPGSHRYPVRVSIATTSERVRPNSSVGAGNGENFEVMSEIDSSFCHGASADFLPQELDRVYANHEQPLQIRAVVRPAKEDFIDPELRRGDLLIMDMHLWHSAAAPNRSDKTRMGIFNKYCGRHFPPATGYYVFNDGVHDALSPSGRRLIAVHSNKPIGTTRVLLERRTGGERQFLFLPGGSAAFRLARRAARRVRITLDHAWSLPGGVATQEQSMPEWDIGNYIASAQAHLREHVRIEAPWLTYVGDYDEGNHLCRVYAYPLNDNGYPFPYASVEWITQSRLESGDVRSAHDYLLRAIADWLDPSMVRGKGLSQAACRIDQFAY